MPQLKVKGNISPKQICSQVGAFLLLALFLNALLIEGLHHHDRKSHGYGQAQTKQLKSQAHFNEDAPKCKLCEVLKHKAQFYDIPVPVAFVLAIVKPEVNTFVYVLKHPVAYILSCANKGPPSAIA